MNDFRFAPDAQRARLIDHRMRTLLGESLEHIADQIRGQISFNEEQLQNIATRLKQGEKYPPSTFAIYTELVKILLAGNFAEAEGLLAELLQEKPVTNTPQIAPLDSPLLARQAERMKQLMGSDPDTEFPITAPSQQVTETFTSRLGETMKLMESTIPELAGEINALISQIIMVVPDSESDYRFDGGSSYMMWGGLFLNALAHENEIALLEVLAHESAHMLLFGFCRDEMLVSNSDDELFPSPLRFDPRPMDGIYHATWVSARMHWAMSQLINSGQLTQPQLELATSHMQADKVNFENGYGVVKQHAKLTPTGRAVMQPARDYMDSVPN
ncbi:hypothetical protein JV46_24870 [Solemya velum gill symbiont]|uniref:HEXXH motif domain-containing protein n=1 Tax=Solemya velum gill symbiont TaxID=2340 RepID=A0A0B0H5G0_SOVGS|nr:HEXXH motif-containing putative peptide modification protein [Solemya velum gill symbiont]KHF24345.1 hypothetical protein JV46_24870 [Solemya velum gill symbiont]